MSILHKGAEMRRVVLAILIIIILSLHHSAIAGADAPLGKRIVLENGMVLLFSERHDLPMVTVNMAIRAGGLSEPVDKPRLSYITASLLMQGTKTRTASDISREIDFIGGSLSVAGGQDYATAGLRVLKKDIRKGFDLLSDVLMNPAFDQKEIDKKVKEFLAAAQRRKQEPAEVAADAFIKAVFGDHPYGRTDDDMAAYLQRLTRQDIIDFYSSRYSPDNTIIAVVGDITEQEIRALIDEFFGKWTRKKAPASAAVPLPEVKDNTVIKIHKDITQANIVMGHVGISRRDPDFYAVMVMNFILGGGGFSSRLMDNIRDNRGLAYDVSSGFDARVEPGAFSVDIQTKNSSANEVIDEVLKEMARIQREPVSEKELADAKAYLTGSFPLRMDTYSKIAAMLISIEVNDLGLDYPKRYRSIINSVTRDDILRVAKKHLRPDRMVIVVVANQDEARLKY